MNCRRPRLPTEVEMSTVHELGGPVHPRRGWVGLQCGSSAEGYWKHPTRGAPYSAFWSPVVTWRGCPRTPGEAIGSRYHRTPAMGATILGSKLLDPNEWASSGRLA